ncbi:TPA: hypothetical protein ACH3X1_002716 [Trebouxia sp. C0004]
MADWAQTGGRGGRGGRGREGGGARGGGRAGDYGGGRGGGRGGDFGGRGGGRGGDYGGRGGGGRGGDFGGRGGGGGRGGDFGSRGGGRGGDFGGRGGGRGGGRDFGGGRGGGGGGGRGRGPMVSQATSATLPTTSVAPAESARLSMKELLSALPDNAKALAKTARPPRPGYCMAGTTVKIKVNHFEVKCNLTQAFHYDVVMTRPRKGGEAGPSNIEESRSESRKKSKAGGVPSRPLPVTVCKQVISKLALDEKWQGWAFDGRKNIYTAKAFMDTNQEHNFKVIVSEPGGPEETFLVRVKWAATVDIRSLTQFVASKAEGALPQDAVQALDVALKNGASNHPDCVTLPRAFFFYDPDVVKPVGGGAEVWIGYNQSLRPCQSGLTLNMDITAAAFLEGQPMLQLIGSTVGMQNVSGGLNPGQVRSINKAIRGVQVEVDYQGSGSYKRKYRVREIIAKGPFDLVFKNEQAGSEMNVGDYYQSAYKIKLNPSLPCLNVGGSGRPTYVPAELATVKRGQRKLKLDERQQAQMIREAAIKPLDRVKRIENCLNVQSKVPTDPTVKTFGMQIKGQMMEIQGQILPAPVLQYGQRTVTTDRRPGSWEPGRYSVPGKMPSYAIASFADRRGTENAMNDFIINLLDECAKVGITDISETIPDIAWHEGGNKTVEDTLTTAVKTGANTFGGLKPALILILLPGNGGPIHGLIKIATDHRLGIPSQCFAAAKAGIDDRFPPDPRKRQQYCGNLVLKINAKLGGQHSLLASVGGAPKLFPHENNPFMIIGADVTHPMGFNRSTPSIASVVGSIDRYATRYAERSRLQGHRVEMIQDFKGMVQELLQEFYRNTKKRPERIIVYRDGVSEGQFDAVVREELPQLAAACLGMGDPNSEYRPPITFVVVQKRHHTRLFPARPNEGDRSGNILPGTLIDRDICHPTEFDFYLNSHAGIQGTNRPCHYHVLLDENKFGAQELALMTFRLCYLFCRATRAVSVCPPAYYAHLAAFRQRELCQMTDSSASDTESTMSGTGADATVEFATCHKDLGATMYYV